MGCIGSPFKDPLLEERNFIGSQSLSLLRHAPLVLCTNPKEQLAHLRFAGNHRGEPRLSSPISELGKIQPQFAFGMIQAMTRYTILREYRTNFPVKINLSKEMPRVMQENDTTKDKKWKKPKQDVDY